MTTFRPVFAALVWFLTAVPAFPSSLEPSLQVQKEAGRVAKFRNALEEGRERLAQRDATGAIAKFKEAITLDPDSGEAHMFLGYAYRLTGSFEFLGEAQAEFRQALSLNPGLFWARLYLGKIYLDLGRPERAKEQMQQFLKVKPDAPEALALMGEVLRQLGDLQGSLSYLQMAVQEHAALGDAHYYLGLTYLDLNQNREALRELEAATKSAPVPTEVYTALGQAYLRENNVERAIFALRKAVSSDVTSAAARIELASAYRRKGDFRKVAEQLEALKRLEKSFLGTVFFQKISSRALFEEGMLRLHQGDRRKARSQFLEAVAVYPENGLAHLELTRIYLGEGNGAEALRHGETAKELGLPEASDLLQQLKSR